jgi:hypothetical protein
MTDREPELDPEQEARVRALLADLHADEAPMPSEVALRLEETLAALVSEREAVRPAAEHTATGEVVPLRPRWMPRLVAGAAAVVVLGLAALVVTDVDRSGGAPSAGSSDSKASATPLSGSASGATPTAPRPSSVEGTSAGPPQVRTSTFARDVSVLLQTTAGREPFGTLTGSSGQDRKAAPPAYATKSCHGPKVTDGARVALIRLDSRPAALVVHPVEKGARLVEAWSCDGSRRLASATLAR